MLQATNPARKPQSAPHDLSLFDHALAYAGRGWSIIPVNGKKGAGLWKPFQTEAAQPEILRSLFAKPGITGLAVVLGAVSGGLAVRDFDDADAYHAWAAANSDHAGSLPTVQTARGFHVYGRLDEEDYRDLGDGELRADAGHYIVLPPSQHPSGLVYRWIIPLPDTGSALPLLPQSLTERASSLKADSSLTQATQATHACVTSAVADAIEATLPDGPGHRNHRLFDFARRLKAIPGLDASPASLKRIVTDWHRQALPFVATKDFGETWTDFQSIWLRVKVPYGVAVTAAYQSARRSSPPPIDDCADLGVLAAMCSKLGTHGQPFYLACRTLEKLFGVSAMTACRWFKSLEFYGVIERVRTGTLTDRQATTWRYIGG